MGIVYHDRLFPNVRPNVRTTEAADRLAELEAELQKVYELVEIALSPPGSVPHEDTSEFGTGWISSRRILRKMAKDFLAVYMPEDHGNDD